LRLLVVSDVHGAYGNLKSLVDVVSDFDALLIAGDLTHYGSGLRGVCSVIKSVVDSGKSVITVLGNMDPPRISEEVSSVGALVLHGSSTELSRYYVVGVSGSPKTPFRTAFELSEGEFRELLSRVVVSDFRKSILLTHAPPYGTKLDRTYFGIHAGSVVIREFIKEKQPLLAICGHIHEGRGTETIGSTTVVNPGPLFRKYYAVVELVKGSVKLELRRLST